MELPVRYLDRADPTIAWQVDPRLGDNQTKPPDHYSLGFIKRDKRRLYRGSFYH